MRFDLTLSDSSELVLLLNVGIALLTLLSLDLHHLIPLLDLLIQRSGRCGPTSEPLSEDLLIFDFTLLILLHSLSNHGPFFEYPLLSYFHDLELAL